MIDRPDLHDRLVDVFKDADYDLPTEQRGTLANIALDALKSELDTLDRYENTMAWHTTCTSCARVLDSRIQETERAEHAEAALNQVRALYESWVHAGPPPLGASMARWWDSRLVELRAALQHDGQQLAPAPFGSPEYVDWRRILDGFEALLRAFPAGLRPDGPAVRPRPLPAGLIARWRENVHTARQQYANQTTKEN